MSKNNIIDIVTSLVKGIIDDTEMRLIEIEYVKEGASWFLRVFIDKPDGVDIDDCSFVSQELSGLLDEVDPIPNAYTLEVSSPGAERPLKDEADYHYYNGRLVNVRTYQAINGIKEFQGKLLAFDGNIVKIEHKGKTYEIPIDKIAKARLAIEF